MVILIYQQKKCGVVEEEVLKQIVIEYQLSYI